MLDLIRVVLLVTGMINFADYVFKKDKINAVICLTSVITFAIYIQTNDTLSMIIALSSAALILTDKIMEKM